MSREASPRPAEPLKFGTFGGVFTPNLLTILGVFMFLRAGWVVGNAGLEQALIILCVANAITLLTSLSLSAVATNIRVKGGGAYFLISRNLGLEIGGAIGLPLFFAQAVSVAFYIIGFVESLQFLFPNLPAREISVGVLAVLFIIAWVGAELAVRTQYVIMAALALALSAVLAGLCLLIGKLDLIAPIITMFFLAAYGTVNFVAGLSRLVSNPSYRPTFRVHWLSSLLGFAGCLFVMFLLNVVATIGSIIVIAGIYVVLKRREYKTAWGDERSGLWFAIARFGLLKLAASQQHVRNWRPVLLVLVGNPKSRLGMVDVADRLEARRGLLVLAQIITGDWQKTLPRQAGVQKAIEEFIQENRLSAVGKTVLSDAFVHGVTSLLQVLGVGALDPNTVLVGWSEDALKRTQFVGAVQRILELERNLLVYAEPELPPHELEPVIDVWWRARINGSFMPTLAHLLIEGSEGRMRDHRIRVRRIIADEAGREEARAMQAMLAEVRIEAGVEILISERPPLEVIAEKSALSDFFVRRPGHRGCRGPGESAGHVRARGGCAQGKHLILAKSWHDLHPGE